MVKYNLREKKERLQKISKTNAPKNPDYLHLHIRKVENAKKFIEELDLLSALKNNVVKKVVSISTFEKMLDLSDYYSEVIDGKFVKCYFVKKAPYDDLYIIWTMPLDKL